MAVIGTDLAHTPAPRSRRGAGPARAGLVIPIPFRSPRIGADVVPAPARGRWRGAHLAGEILLTVAAVGGLLVGGAAFLATKAGIRPVVVQSGSMAPAIPVGSMILAQRIDAADIAVGDVVAVSWPDGSRVTHRVTAVEHDGDLATLTMKGDANEDPDPVPVTVRTAERVVWHSAGIGRAASWLATPGGGFVLGSLLTALILGLMRSGFRAGPRHRRPRLRVHPADARAG